MSVLEVLKNIVYLFVKTTCCMIKTTFNKLLGVTMLSNIMERLSPTAMRALSLPNPMTKAKHFQTASKLSASHISDRLWKDKNGV